MAWTQANLDALDAAIIAAGIAGWAELNFDGQGKKRYSLDELLRLRSVVQGVVSKQNTPTMCNYASFTKD